ncbi:Zinc dependent phospholipase C [Granulicella rosea]|uniref:Zinc dependent phospholipase C n=2 Tax=Granulicella rosea TaxID=474952 RepID=A0A239KTI6_9BACT|nr:Zinc dependent phospholipase C [Granulicella rosea]
MLWLPQIVPLLKSRFPGLTDEQIRHAHAFAYGGSVIQDIGYYPFGSHYFSDLLHYVRTGDFVEQLIRDSTTPDEYAFALGALAHYCGDTIGHPFINQITADEYPALRKVYGQSVTYDQNSTAHLRTEFGFDVVGVANGVYSQEAYRDFIGFQVAKPLLERAFHETYGLKMSDVIRHEDLAIATYRYSVSSLIPKMTKVALVSYHDRIEQAHPGFDRTKFLYRFNRTEFNKQYGRQYKKPGIGTHVAGFFIRILPKIGPFKALQLSIPNSDEQTIYLRSVNATVDRYRLYLSKVHAKPADAPDDPAQAPVSTRPPFVPELADLDMDTGHPSDEGEYRLADRTHAHLLSDLATGRAQAPPELRQIMLTYYAHAATTNDELRKKPRKWKKVQTNLTKMEKQGTGNRE